MKRDIQSSNRAYRSEGFCMVWYSSLLHWKQWISHILKNSFPLIHCFIKGPFIVRHSHIRRKVCPQPGCSGWCSILSIEKWKRLHTLGAFEWHLLKLATPQPGAFMASLLIPWRSLCTETWVVSGSWERGARLFSYILLLVCTTKWAASLLLFISSNVASYTAQPLHTNS